MAAKWKDVDMYISRSGPFMIGQLDDEQSRIAVKEFFSREVRILVIGAGGLGCEILKNLATCGFNNIEVVDMDTIDLSNLNRQFLFTDSDISLPKAQVAAAAITKRVSGCRVVGHYKAIQDLDDEFYSQFQVVVCGLDSIEARRWINATLQRIYRESLEGDSDAALVIPMIDGGTEGFDGQARVIIPGKSCCFECLMSWFPSSERRVYPVCTIASTPRLPEHCIEWAIVLLWPKEHGEQPLDGDCHEHVQFIYDAASARAEQFGIQGVTLSLTQGVMKNIVTAIASTNAIIAAACANEAFKMCTMSNPALDNYWQYVGTQGVATATFLPAIDPDCPVCQRPNSAEIDCPEGMYSGLTLGEFITENLVGAATRFNLKAPSISLLTTYDTSAKPLYATGALHAVTKGNLTKTFAELQVPSGSKLLITDSSVPFPIFMTIAF